MNSSLIWGLILTGGLVLYITYYITARWTYRLLEDEDWDWVKTQAPHPASACCEKPLDAYAVQGRYVALRCEGCWGIWFLPIVGRRRL